MITLTARINLLSTSGAGQISSAEPKENTPQGNNISAGIPVGQKKAVGNPFLLGISKLDEGDTYSDGEDYFIGSEYADGNGDFARQYEIVISGEDITAFTICFDEQHGRFPHSIKVYTDSNPNYEVYTDDDPNYTISVTQGTTQKIVIDNWNTPNYPLVISGIFVDLSIDLDYNCITDISRKVRERSDTAMPSWGILSSGDDLSFSDYDGEFLDYIEQGILKSGVEVTINLNNTLFGKTQSGEWAVSEQVAKYYVDGVDYDVNNKEVLLSVKDGLEKLQEVKGIYLECNPLHYEHPQFSEIYDIIRQRVQGEGIEMKSFEDLDATSKQHLQFVLPVPLTSKDDTLWGFMEKFCSATNGHFYVGNDGVLTYKYSEDG